MNTKTYRIWQIITVIIVGGVVGLSAVIENWILALAAVITGMLVTIIFRRSVKGVITDERNYTVAYKAARFTLGISSIAMAAVGTALLAINHNNLDVAQAQIGFTLVYATCGMLVLNTLAYIYYNRTLGGKE
jgi:uncharacterized membrane protein